VALRTTLQQQCQIQDYQNKGKWSTCTRLLLQRKPKLGRTKPSTGPQIGHSWIKKNTECIFIKIKANNTKLVQQHKYA